MPEDSQFDFLKEYVMRVLTDTGLADLTDEQKQMYVPAITAQLERRIGYHMMPLLSDGQLDRFAEMTEQTQVSPEDWRAFWTESIPNFEEELAKVLQEFAKDVKEIVRA